MEVSVVGDRFKNIQVKFNGKPGKEVSAIELWGKLSFVSLYNMLGRIYNNNI